MDPNAVQGTGLLRVTVVEDPETQVLKPARLKLHLDTKKKPHTHQQIQRGAEKKDKSQAAYSWTVSPHKENLTCVELVTICCG